MVNKEVIKDYRHNLIVNLLDGSFFGFAMGFASFMTVVPLFVSSMTASALLIGLIPSIHAMGWQLPQLFTAHSVSRLTRYKPMVLLMTLNERLPFLGLAVVAWLLPKVGPQIALALTFALLIWQGLGAGFTANPWQAMIAKIIPSGRRGTFLGLQSAGASLLSSLSAVLSGLLLANSSSQRGYVLCFIFASLSMAASFFALASTREEHSQPVEIHPDRATFQKNLVAILRRDSNFRWFLIVRSLSMFAVMAFSFYTVYAVRRHHMEVAVAGLMMGIYTFGQIFANPLMGWIGDHWSNAAVMKIGLLGAGLSALVAAWAPSLGWFYLVFALAGIANVSVWTIAMTMTMQFGQESERPAYIGMANTLVAPVTILAPLLGGWLADAAGFQITFIVAGICGLATALILHGMVRDPQPQLANEEYAPLDLEDQSEVAWPKT
jgi:MFS family permease